MLIRSIVKGPSPWRSPLPLLCLAASMGGVWGRGWGVSLTRLGMVAVLPQAGILCIQEPKGLNFKEGEKQKNDICKISGTSTVHFRLLCSHPPFSLQPTALLSKQVSMRVGPCSGPFSRGLLGTWAQRILATPSSSAGNGGWYWEGD